MEASPLASLRPSQSLESEVLEELERHLVPDVEEVLLGYLPQSLEDELAHHSKLP